MRALAFWKAVTVDETDLLERICELLGRHDVLYCVIGGQAVNAYVEPLVSLDLDLAVAAGHLRPLEQLLVEENLPVKRFEHSVNVSAAGSDLRVQFQTDERYQAFPERAEFREVLGKTLPVARVEDVLQGKVWATQDRTRRPSKRQKDLADIARLIETYPHLRAQVPDGILSLLV